MVPAESRKTKTTQRLLLTEVGMCQTDQISCHLSRKFQGETSKDQHQQTFRWYSAESHKLLGIVCIILVTINKSRVASFAEVAQLLAHAHK